MAMNTPTFEISTPERESVSLSFPDVGLEIGNWTEYEYAADIEVPSDGWSFTMSGDDVVDRLKGLQAFQLVGQRVRLTVNGAVQGTGIVDSADLHIDRRTGTVFNVQGR